MAYTYGSVTNCKVRNGQTRSEYQCRLGYEVQSQSIANNTSSVKLRLECRSISSSYTTKGSSGLTSKIDGTTVKSNASVDMSNTNTWQNFGERTITVTHNADGTYSASKSGSFTCTAGSSSYSLSSGSASVTVKPATIPRASTPTVSASSVAMGSSVTINTNRVSSSFTHIIKYKFGGASGTIASNVGTSTTWTLPLSLANQIPNATSGTGTITCQTYNGSTLIGSKSINITLTVPSSVVPSISSIALSAGNSNVPSSWGVYVQGKSALKVVTTASGSYGSTIKSYKITGIDNNTYYSSNFTSSILQSSGTKTITATVTDSRGRTATKTTTYTCVAYSNPSITTATVTRCNSDGTANEEGEYVKYSFKASVASVSSKNTYSYKIGYKNSTSSSYTYITISNSAYTLDKSNVVISGVTFSVDNSYDFDFLVTDYFTSTSVKKSIGTGFTLMDFNSTGKGMAIGKVSEDDKLEVALPTEFTEDVTLNKSTSNENAYYKVKRSDIGTEIAFGIGSGGINHGLWSYLLNKWIVYGDASNVYLNGKATSADTATKANSAGTLSSRGVLAPESGQTHIPVSGISMSQGYNNDYPANFGNVLNLKGAGSSQLFMEWKLNSSSGGVWYRSLRDYLADGTTWGSWVRLVDERARSIVANESGTKSYITLGNLKICWGKATITPSSANTPTSVSVTFPSSFSDKPTIIATPVSTLPGTKVTGVGVSNESSTGFNIYLTRTDKTNTSVNWLALGQA